MENLCRRCGQKFYTVKTRSVCLKCSPNLSMELVQLIVSDVEAGKTYNEICQARGIDRHKIADNVQAFGIPRKKEERGAAYYGELKLDLDWVDGWLLGDGCLFLHPKGKNAHCQHGSKYEAYTDYVRQHWGRMWMRFGPIHPVSHVLKEKYFCYTYHAASQAHPVLTEQYHRWYPQGEKRIPKDVSVAPVSVREWYYGDGTYKSNLVPLIYMSGVTRQEMEFMKAKLNELFGGSVKQGLATPDGVTSVGNPFQPVYALTIEDAPAFFSYIGPCTLPCYTYKWPTP